MEDRFLEMVWNKKIERNWVFATHTIGFSKPYEGISALQPNVKTINSVRSNSLKLKNKGLHYQIAELLGLENLSLWP